MILTPTAYLNTLDFMSDHTRQIKQMIHHLSNLLGLTHFVMAHVEKKNKLVGLTMETDTPGYWVEQSMPLPLILPNGFYLVSQFKDLFPEFILKNIREKYAVDHYPHENLNA